MARRSGRYCASPGETPAASRFHRSSFIVNRPSAFSRHCDRYGLRSEQCREGMPATGNRLNAMTVFVSVTDGSMSRSSSRQTRLCRLCIDTDRAEREHLHPCCGAIFAGPSFSRAVARRILRLAAGHDGRADRQRRHGRYRRAADRHRGANRQSARQRADCAAPAYLRHPKRGRDVCDCRGGAVDVLSARSGRLDRRARLRRQIADSRYRWLKAARLGAQHSPFFACPGGQ
ncbi:hypothetical protein BCO18442_02810 [Burkholderia contaminans]|nr:hypothetical protein BCO18442_02810 [Burkholderia contaminans]